MHNSQQIRIDDFEGESELRNKLRSIPALSWYWRFLSRVASKLSSYHHTAKDGGLSSSWSPNLS